MSQHPGPVISVIIPCYNQGRYLGEAIDSALGQTYPHVEVLVVDDGPTDETPQVAARYGDNVRYYRKENAGLAAARNTGLLEARGEFLLFLDADDYIWTDMLERHMAVAAAHPDAAVFHGVSQEVDLEGRVLSHYLADLEGDPFHTLLKGNRFAIHALTVRRSVLANVGLFDVRLPACEDWDLWLRLAAAEERFVSVPDAVAVYRRYPGSMSGDYWRMWPTGLAVMAKSRGYHPRCVRCREALTTRLRTWRQWCFPMLLNELKACKTRDGKWHTLARAGRAFAHDPALAAPYLQWVMARAQHAWGRWRVGHSTSSCAGSTVHPAP